jgi:hypothetical protein
MSRWTAPSDRDYDDEVEHRRRTEVEVTCLDCQRPFTIWVDERPPYRCDDCLRAPRHATTRQERAS